MAPEEAQQNAPRRRGRPPGSKNRTTTARRGRPSGGALVGQLNAMVAELIRKNRQLQRQVATLSQKAGANKKSKTVDRDIRTLSRRVQRALATQPTRRRRAASSNGRRKKGTTTRRRRAS